MKSLLSYSEFSSKCEGSGSKEHGRKEEKKRRKEREGRRKEGREGRREGGRDGGREGGNIYTITLSSI